jgi:hypothetical protein
MYSIIFTAAIFIGVILNDVLQKHNKNTSRHFFLGMLAISLVTILWYLEYEIVGWALVVLPIFVLLISYITLVTGSTVTKTTSSPVAATTLSTASSAAPVQSCQPINPPGPYTAVAQPTPSTVSLPASIGPPPTPAGTPMSTNKTLPVATITPITAAC